MGGQKTYASNDPNAQKAADDTPDKPNTTTESDAKAKQAPKAAPKPAPAETAPDAGTWVHVSDAFCSFIKSLTGACRMELRGAVVASGLEQSLKGNKARGSSAPTQVEPAKTA